MWLFFYAIYSLLQFPQFHITEYQYIHQTPKKKS